MSDLGNKNGIRSSGHWLYVMSVGVDVEKHLSPTKSHESGHTAIPEQRERLATPPTPPACVAFLLHMFLSEDDREAIAGDLIEGYAKRHARYAKCRAKLWFYGQVTLSLWPLLTQAADAQRRGHRGLAGSQNGTDEQDLHMSPDRLGKQRAKFTIRLVSAEGSVSIEGPLLAELVNQLTLPSVLFSKIGNG